MPVLQRGRLPSVRIWVVIALSIGLAALWIPRITGSHLETDATESTRMAVSLVHHGVMSLDECDDGCALRGIFVQTKPGNYAPTNFREPVPVLVTALGVAIVDSFLGPAEPEAYLEGARARYLKFQNLLWLTLLSVSTFWVLQRFTDSLWFAALGVAVVNYQLLPAEYTVDNLLTELPAMAVLLPASMLLGLAFVQRRWPLFALAGLSFGILALIKAIILYVFCGAVAVLICLYPFKRPLVPWREALRELLVMVTAFACVVAPWLYRNYIELGTLQLTQRGGEALWERALVDQISAEEYRGAIYLWAPGATLQNWLGKRLHFSKEDLQRGGRLQRLDTEFSSALSRSDRDNAVAHARPEDAITLFRQAQAERVKLQRQFAAAGSARPDVDAERTLYSKAEALIVAHPGRHLALTAACMWRGAARTFPVFVIASLLALQARRYDLLLFVLPAFGMTLMYALFSPFFFRYGMLPRMIGNICILILIKWAWDRWLATRTISERARSR